MPRLFAHRGSSGTYAENTRAAYLQALADGADGIETDVHLSADGVVVCHHDAVLGRTEAGSGPIGSLKLAELRALDVSSWKGVTIPPEYGGVDEQFCTLAELVGIAAGAGRPLELAIETKHQLGDDPRLEPAVRAELERLGFDPATRRAGDLTVSLMSFEPLAVHRLVADWGREGVCQLIEDKRRGWEADVLRGATAPDTDAYARIFTGAARNLADGVAGIAGPGVEMSREHEPIAREWFSRLRGRVWTVDRVEDARFLLGIGVEELTSNVPAALRAGLAA